MRPTSPTFWLLVALWATATAFFLSKLEKRKSAVLVILLSLVLVAVVRRTRERAPATEPSLRAVSRSHVAASG